MKMLLLVAALLLPSAVARAEDRIAKINTAPESAAAADPDNDHAAAKAAIDCDRKLGVARVAEVDTTGGGEYGEQYTPKPLLEKGEVVLTFDDGPHPKFTREILDALAAQCTKATFFYVGRMIKEFPRHRASGAGRGSHNRHPHL